MWPFRKRRPEPLGSLRLGEPGMDPADYSVFTVSESRHGPTFEELWNGATEDERQARLLHRWATLVPVRDPAFGVADLAVEFDGRRACYVRPPHLGRLAARLDAENLETLEVPALIAWGPVGPTVTLRVADDI
jgi:hypothetical protein